MWSMPDFRRPLTQRGRSLRKEASIGASARSQSTYLDNVAQDEANIRMGASATVWQLKHGDKELQDFALEQLKELIAKYSKVFGDQNGTSGAYLTRISSELNVDLGDILATRGEKEAVIALLHKRPTRRKRR